MGSSGAWTSAIRVLATNLWGALARKKTKRLAITIIAITIIATTIVNNTLHR